MVVTVHKYILGHSGRLQEIQGENSKIWKGWLSSDRRVHCLRDRQGCWVFRGGWDWHVSDA
jgi:hypothetical protein